MANRKDNRANGLEDFDEMDDEILNSMKMAMMRYMTIELCAKFHNMLADVLDHNTELIDSAPHDAEIEHLLESLSVIVETARQSTEELIAPYAEKRHEGETWFTLIGEESEDE